MALASAGTPHNVAMFGEVEQLKKMCEEDENTSLDTPDDRGFTPLNWAARNGHQAVLEFLVDKGCSLESPSFGGLRPLHHACNKNLE